MQRRTTRTGHRHGAARPDHQNHQERPSPLTDMRTSPDAVVEPLARRSSLSDLRPAHVSGHDSFAQLKFKPASREGHPISVRATVRYNFRRISPPSAGK